MKAWFAVSILFLLFPVATGSRPFVSITEILVIEVSKNIPPHIAFEEVSRIPVADEWDAMDAIPAEKLSTENLMNVAERGPALPAPRVILERMLVEKPTVAFGEPEIVSTHESEASGGSVPDELLEQLTPMQQRRVIAAQMKHDILGSADRSAEEFTMDSTSESAREVLAKAARETAGEEPTILASGETENRSTGGASVTWLGTPVPAAAVSRDEQDRRIVQAVREAQRAGSVLKGPLEIVGGLAVTHQHHLEILRRQEGIVVDRGEVDLRDGTYKIPLQGRQGDIVARLVDPSGRVLGEGGFRLSQLQKDEVGPKIVVRPRVDLAGGIASLYGGKTPSSLKGSLIRDLWPLEIAKNGDFEVNGFERGSSTVLHAHAPGFAETNRIVLAGESPSVQLFPLSMLKALREIVSEHQQVNLLNPEGPVIWGKVLQDGKPLAGIQVEIESAPEVAPIYLNELMIPDPSLKGTSSNGLFAFVGVSTGFHALAARRGNGFLGHQNVVTEPGGVSLTEITTSIRTEQMTIRTFDAFSGEARSAGLVHQASEEEIEIGESGFTTLLLPAEKRLSLVEVRPDHPYIPSRSLALDSESYLHIPLVREDWLLDLKGRARVDDGPESGVLVGFVNDDDFTVDLAGVSGSRIIYFDKYGRWMNTDRGPRGGGFVLFNCPTGVHEVVVMGAKSGAVMSRVVPVDSRAVITMVFKRDDATLSF